MEPSIKNRGYVLIAVILILTLLGIIVPALIVLLQKDSKDAVGTNKKTTALQLAEAGQDRGAWKLRESDTTWNTAAAGTAITNYNNDTVFTDVPGGSYKIQFSAGPGLNQITVTSKGMASGSSDVRAIKGVYGRNAVTGALTVQGGIFYKPNMNIEWGPVVSYTSIDSPSNTFPRKYSAGQIVGRCTTPGTCNNALPSGNWTTSDFVAFYSLGNPPSIDLNKYRTLAQNSCVPLLSGVAPSPGPGGCNSGYYNGNADLPDGYSFTQSTSVIFIEGSSRLNNNSWVDINALLVVGDITYKAKSTNYSATIPAAAQNEYQYAGGAYGSSAQTYWTSNFASPANPTYPLYTISGCGMHGFLFCGGSMATAAGTGKMCGALYIVGSININTFTIYYDGDVATKINLLNATVNRVSWDETRTSW